MMLSPSYPCFLIVALMTMVMKNSADAQPDQNYGATLFIKVSNILDKYFIIVTVFSSKLMFPTTLSFKIAQTVLLY